MFLVLVDTHSSYVEVRNAINGRLRQIVSGKDVKLLDDGGVGRQQQQQQSGRGEGKVKICMQHPEWERCQIVFELVINEGLKE